MSTIDFARYDFEARGLDAVARASVHYYNTEDELARFVGALRASRARSAPSRGDAGGTGDDRRVAVDGDRASTPAITTSGIAPIARRGERRHALR